MTVKDFGITKDGIATKLYTLKNNNLEISVTDFGSTLVALLFLTEITSLQTSF